MGQLQPLNLSDFTGGLRAGQGQATLADNESPDMLNVEIDSRAGYRTRKGWQRWNADDIKATLADWTPRSAKQHLLTTGTFGVFVANELTAGTGEIVVSDASGVFGSAVGTPCNAVPHIADLSIWGDSMYVASGAQAASVSGSPFKVNSLTTAVTLGDAALAFNPDYTVPVRGRMPFADLCETHASYLFVAGIKEGGQEYPNRLRWSHPNEPEDWAADDYLDILSGGGRITGLLSFQDHLLIFKTDSVWALYGYSLESWQLVQVSESVGCPHPGASCRSESAIYFFSASDRGGIYAYTGSAPIYISDRIRAYTENVSLIKNVWVEWTGRRLWCVIGPDVLVFDPEVGEGAWARHRPAVGTMGPVVKRSDVDAEYPLACLNADSEAAVLVRLDYRPDCFDVILESYSGIEGDPFPAFYRTRWYDAGWPERRKSWRRPRFLFRTPDQNVAVRIDAYWNYNETKIRRTRVGLYSPSGGVFWTAGGAVDASGKGFDWGDGSQWGAAEIGGNLERVSTGLGVADALQLVISSDPSTPGRAWTVDAMFLKFIMRRFTT